MQQTSRVEDPEPLITPHVPHATFSTPDINSGAGDTQGSVEARSGWLMELGLRANEWDHMERTALHTAAGSGQAAACEALLLRQSEASAAELNLVDAQDWQGATPVHLAVGHGSAAVCRLLAAKRADLQAGLEFGVTPLQMAAEKGHEEVLNLLLADVVQRGGPEAILPAIVAARVSDGRGAWLLAAAEGQLGCCKALRESLSESELGALAPDRSGRGAMVLAARGGHTELCSWLLQSGACPAGLAEIDSCGWTPLHAASAEGHKGTVEWLLEHNADPMVGDEEGKTAREWAELRGRAAIESLLRKAEKAKS
ncbi:unnamed protein product [Polarella glacialis]|uniref:Uncharacterized protein n=1 Tax=Polarella glacialis TaxID=89957 RepID=A0A813EZQ3_POLGL|nr:unnamed protein product [Polarella glacialis]